MIDSQLERVVNGEDLELEEMEDAMQNIMEGRTTDSQLAGFLVGLRIKGETIAEITAAAKVMREKAISIDAGRGLVDTCGTGGDGAGTFNISTTTAFVVAGAGLKIAKHGNRSVSSQSGSADVLEALGVKLSISPDQVEKCIAETGIGFLYAPALHKAMKHAIGPRKELGLRTIFNALGPLTNPAGADYQVLGVYDPKLVRPLAEALNNLGSRGAMVVHGSDGLDEFSLSGENLVSRVTEKGVESFIIAPEDVNLKRYPVTELTGGGPEENAAIIRSLLQGSKGPRRDVVLFNSAAALLVTGKVADWEEALDLAAATIDSGRAMEKLEQLVEFTRSAGVAS